MKLADALLRRKELQEKVDQVRKVKETDCFEMQFKRQKITEEIDDITARVPKLTLAEVTKEYDYYANKMRLIDAAIQQANWTTEIMVADVVWVDYVNSEATETESK